MGQQLGGVPLSSQESSNQKHDFFDAYKVAIDDLHRTKNLAQKIDSLYVTILTLLLTADAYETATTKFSSWVPVVATAGVAFIGLAINGRWRKGASNLFRIITNRYAWLREAETHPDMHRIAANSSRRSMPRSICPR